MSLIWYENVHFLVLMTVLTSPAESLKTGGFGSSIGTRPRIL
jgi:hypothetical protein